MNKVIQLRWKIKKASNKKVKEDLRNKELEGGEYHFSNCPLDVSLKVVASTSNRMIAIFRILKEDTKEMRNP